MMRRANVVLALVVVAATLGVWGLLARPVSAPPWPASIAGFAFSPLSRGEDPTRAVYPSAAAVDADLALVAKHARSIRTYSLAGPLADVPALAARHGLDVTLGVWLGDDRKANAEHLAKLRDVVRGASNVTRVIVGNEVLLRKDLTEAELIEILDDARRDLDVPVGTAEPWHIWKAHPELAAHVDFLAVHVLPYWEGIDAQQAVDYVAARVHELEAEYPSKPVVLGEVGWPSFGRTVGRAVASPAAAATFLRRFLARAEHEGYDYFVMEAFDQPWKRADEGEAGAYWGFYDAARRPKYAASGPVAPMRHARVFAAASAALALAAFLALVADGRRLRCAGRLFLAAAAAAAGVAVGLSAALCAREYWSAHDVLAAAVVAAGLLGVVFLLLVEAHEWAEARWARRHRRAAAKPARRLPKVSIHVPTHREPPEMVIETLRALAALDYPSFEVLVVDNNTDDERLWRPVEACCRALGPRFRFFHVAPLDGYKAGALNFALARTAPDAEIVALVDSDYVVEADWLRDLVPELEDPSLSIVQAPQAYRDGSRGVFKAMCDAEYRGFFRIGMITRNERDAIIHHGTMTLIRRRTLESVGGWAEWTITEDAELGLRVLEHGGKTLYTPRCYGRGLTPVNFLDYKSQRYRWALGAMQIMKRHARELGARRRTALTRGQRYHFLSGWLPWLGDAVNLVFNVLAIAWSAAMVALPDRCFAPVACLSASVLGLFAFKLAKTVVLYRSEVRASALETVGALVAGLALVQVVGVAVIAGLAGRRAPFCRTPKLAQRQGVAGALGAALPETMIASALIASSIGVATLTPLPSLDTKLWAALLAASALPHAAALTLSLIGAAGRRARQPAHAPGLGAPLADSAGR
ncbi:MAG TPA: glycosyltransferase family 2 protein [Gammaproteobacteria bacterium]|nr:glycosyltransferase family 2 protein [Gammaproteobacteria bacterium]